MKPRKERREASRQRYERELIQEQPDVAQKSAELAALLAGQDNEGEGTEE